MSVTVNNSYQVNPQSVAAGGTGIATTTAYGLLLGGTTANGPLQNGGTGTTGQLYLMGGAGAAGTWTNQNQIGAWNMISSQAASSSANISFTGLVSTYYAYKVVISALVPATNATNLWLRTSSNNGSSYDSGAGNYGYINAGVNDSGAAVNTTTNSNSATQILIGSAWSNAAFSSNIEIIIIDPATSLSQNGFTWSGKYNDSTQGSSFVIGAGSRLATQVNNAFIFQMSSGNITSGTFTLYGILA